MDGHDDDLADEYYREHGDEGDATVDEATDEKWLILVVILHQKSQLPMK